MRIRMLTEREGYRAGRTYDLPDEEALRLLKAGAAEIANVETAALKRGTLREPRSNH